MISYQNVSKKYQNSQNGLAINQLNLTIEQGELFVLVGPSGSGKTTLLKMLNRLIEPTEGNIYLNDRRLKEYDLRQLRLQTGYVLQNISLFPNLTIEDNIAIQLEELKVARTTRLKRAHELLALVDLDPASYAKRLPNELSGGEQQRVGIIRALATEPKVVLMDEPFSALDPVSRKRLQGLILDLHKKLKTTVVFVTHDMNEALRLGTRIGIMHNGKIQQVGTPREIIEQPANEFVQQFFASIQAPPTKLITDLIATNHYQSLTKNPNTNPMVKTSDYPRINKDCSLSELSLALQQNPDGVSYQTENELLLITLNDLLNYFIAGGSRHA